MPAKGKFVKKTTHLHLQDKHLKSIPEIKNASGLCVVYLHNNAIRNIENLDYCVDVVSLYLQNNKIAKIENLHKLKSLKKLYLSQNEISVVENLEQNEIEELYLERQKLKRDALCFEPRSLISLARTIQVLNISHNNITSISSLGPLRWLKVFNVSHNKLNDMQDILSAIQHWYYLFEANFVGNPVAKMHRFRENVIARTVRLEMLDNKQINETTRCFIKRMEQEKLQHKSEHGINLADIHPGLPNNYPPPLQKAVSSSIIKTGLSVSNVCTENKRIYVPWNALPQSFPILRKPAELKSKEHAKVSDNKGIEIK